MVDVKNVLFCRRVAELDADEARGVVDYSPLFDLRQPFDLVWQTPPELFHLMDEGLTKLMLGRLLFQRDSAESRDTVNRLQMIYSNIRVFSETPRRSRTLLFSKLKGAEFHLLTLSVLPLIATECIKSDKDEWLVQ